ncbi:DUF580-domain-containing protein, partial [Leucogyrophana mollusca]
VAGLFFFEAVSYLWTSQVIGDVALATLAGGPWGIAGDGAFCFPFAPKTQLTRRLSSKHLALLAFRRAATFTLGSIAFGSLIVALLEILRLVLNAAWNNANASKSRKSALALPCFMECIESMVKCFSIYAYIEIALYGKPYISAVRDTWNMFKDHGIDALVNGSLGSTNKSGHTYVLERLTPVHGSPDSQPRSPRYAEGQYTVPVVLLVFSIGLQCCMSTNALSSALETGVSTT